MDLDIYENILSFGENNGLVGVITQPVNADNCKKICMLFLNPGIIHKIGTNRLNVKIARKVSQLGYTCFRFDFSGLGDSTTSPNFVNNPEKQKIKEVIFAMDKIQEQTGISSFILKGICSGAEIAFKASLVDDRVSGLILIDGIYEDRNDIKHILSAATKNTTLRYYKKNMFNIYRWRKLISGNSKLLNKKNIRELYQMIKSKFSKDDKSARSHSNFVNFDVNTSLNKWTQLLNKNKKILLIFCEGGMFIDIFNMTIADKLDTLENKNLITFKYIKDVDHTFTSIWSQRKLISIVTDWVDRENVRNIIENNV